jgi:hypothetical protein
LPFLRFTRDKRGYETTSLVHSFRGRHGRTRQKVLYWFRTPPNVKVGRPALDEEAIRWIEEHNPDIDFDWQQILEATPPPSPPPEEAKGRRSERRAKGVSRRGKTAQEEPQPAHAPEAEVPSSEQVEAVTPLVASPVEEPPASPEARALEQLTHPDAEELPPITSAPATIESLVGHEQLTRLRARFAELQARIAERAGDPARMEALRAQAEPLNPDAWVTADDAKSGIEQFETRIRALRAALGLKRRRRSRRGGRHRRRAGPPGDHQTAAPGPTSDDGNEQGDED